MIFADPPGAGAGSGPFDQHYRRVADGLHQLQATVNKAMDVSARATVQVARIRNDRRLS